MLYWVRTLSPWLKMGLIVGLATATLTVGEYWLAQTTNWPTQWKSGNPAFRMVLQTSEDMGGWLVGQAQVLGQWMGGSDPQSMFAAIPNDLLTEESDTLGLNHDKNSHPWWDEGKRLTQSMGNALLPPNESDAAMLQAQIDNLDKAIAEKQNQLQALQNQKHQLQSTQSPWTQWLPQPGDNNPLTFLGFPSMGHTPSAPNNTSSSSGIDKASNGKPCVCP